MHSITRSCIFSTDGVVQVTASTLSIVEGTMADFCIRLTGTTGSPNMLDSDLTVTFSITNDNAGMYFCSIVSHFLV